MDDHALSGYLAALAGERLTELRAEALASGMNPWALRDRGDQVAHDLLMVELAKHRPDDAVLSEEGADDRSRLGAARTWIVDPLDGTQDYPYADSVEWAVHVALVEDGVATAGSVACPALGRQYTTGPGAPTVPDSDGQLTVISGRSNAYHAAEVADALGARLTACGSAGIKAALVIGGEADVYVHASGLYEWDACAPVAVAEAAGLVARELDGAAFEFNKPQPTVRGLVVTRPELADEVFAVLRW